MPRITRRRGAHQRRCRADREVREDRLCRINKALSSCGIARYTESADSIWAIDAVNSPIVPLG
jgi:hypothetical protein